MKAEREKDRQKERRETKTQRGREITLGKKECSVARQT